MSNRSTQAKMRYNRSTYKRYEFNLRVDSKINAIVERYKSYPDANLSRLLKELLCKHFGLDIDEADNIYPAYYFDRKGGLIPNTGLDKYFPTEIE